MRRNVSFAKVTVREYEQTLGDQPCASGPPVSLGWEFQDALAADVEDYEASREGLRRIGHEMKMPPSVRVQKLLDNGLTRHQINQTAISSRKAMQGRVQTAKESEARHLAAKALESLGRKVKRVVRRNNSSDDLWWMQAAQSSNATEGFRSSCPEMRRVQSMGEFLTKGSTLLLSSGPVPTRGILKSSQPTSNNDADTVEESDSDTSPNLGRRCVSMNENHMPTDLGRPVEEVSTAEQPNPSASNEADEDGMFF
mmetsp:Transcript_12974/g.24625  ORF Transcript_12974/g.24625 Transcript_12974/m.24625 type:complete len:254 (+) Transcript_12974:160-921(+)|eukprot:scaffold2366_cov159-Amphora_coffeaeformis.AAC.16